MKVCLCMFLCNAVKNNCSAINTISKNLKHFCHDFSFKGSVRLTIIGLVSLRGRVLNT